MTPIRVSGPLVEPVTLADLKRHLRFDGDDDGAEDLLLAELIATARLHVEARSGRVLLDSLWRVGLPAWPSGGVAALPLSPVLAVTEVRVVAPDGGATLLDASVFALDPGQPDPPRLRLTGPARPGRLEIGLRAGYGAEAAAVPEPLRHAVRLLAARWYEARGDAAEAAPLPPDVALLVAPYRRARL